MPSITWLLRMLIKYGPTVVRIVRQIAELIDALHGEPAVGPSTRGAYRRRFNNELTFLDGAPKVRKPEALTRLRSLRSDLHAERGRARR